MISHPPSRAGLIVLGAALIAVTGVSPVMAETGPATSPAAAAPPGATATATAAGNVRTVTLITGDVVTVRQDGSHGGTVSVRGADGSAAAARVIESGDDLYVYPQVAMPYVAAKMLDKRLFDVTQLLADGYDDAHTDHLPLIVTYTDSAARARTQAVPSGAAKVRTLSSVQGAALTEDRDRATDFWSTLTAGAGAGARASGATPAFAGGIAKVWLDGKVEETLADTTAQIGAPEVWSGGDTGEGVDVAVLDTGVDTGHPDLAGRITETASFVPDEDVNDYQGHGTHVASTIAGTGAASGGKEKGVAPGADLHIGKVLSNAGSGQDSWVIAGMEWAARDQHAKIISMSLGSGPSDGSDPVSQAVNTLSEETGALFVIAAGNFGAPSTIAAPGAADAALTVGAVDSTDQLAFFSSQGPRLGDEALKPELTAPGVDVLAARSQYVDGGEGYYQTMSGTSMATPHVAGAAALLAAAHPDWTGQQLKDALVSTTKPTPDYDAYQAGTGRLDIAAAVRGTVFATGTAYTSIPADPITRQSATSPLPVTYTNTADTPVTLDLAIDASAAPAGLFTLSEQQVTVPAHATRTVTLTVDTGRVETGSRHTGQITATGPGGAVLARTAIAVGTARKYHTLRLVMKDRSGKPMSGTVEFMHRGSQDPDFLGIDKTGMLELYLPENVYSAMAFVDVQGAHGPHSLGLALLGDPEIVLDRDTEVVLDGSAAREVRADTPKVSTPTFERLEYFRSMDGSFRSFMLSGPPYDSLWAQPTKEKVTHGDFFFTTRWRKEQPVLSVSSPKADYDDLLQQSFTTQLPAGRQKLVAVYAGNGTPADYAGMDVRGKAVVVRRDPAVISDLAQAAAATAAGAKLLLVQDDKVGRHVRRYAVDFTVPTPIEVASLGMDEGEKLIKEIAGGKVTLTVTSAPVSDYDYDIVEMNQGAIPADPVYHANDKNLARIDEGFYGDPTAQGGEFRYDWPSYSDWGIGGEITSIPVRGTRTDWVSTEGSYSWGQEAYIDGLKYEIDTRGTYAAGSTSEEEWFKPIERPHLNNNYKSPTRTGGVLNLDVPGFGGADHVGMAMDTQGMRQTLSLYQGDTLLKQATSTWLTANAPAPGRLPYRAMLDTAKDASIGTYSTTTHTEWNFQSGAPEEGTTAVLPLLQLGYDVDTDADGRARREADLVVTADHLPGAYGTGAIGPVDLDVSYDDGVTWRKASLTRTGADGWKAGLHAPVSARYLSIRVSAQDVEGNGVTQTVIRATGLR